MDFNLEYANEETVRNISKARGEPKWLLKDRLAALRAFGEIPVESLPLFVRHTDIRGVDVAKLDPPQNVGARMASPVYNGEDKAALGIIDEGEVSQVRIIEKLRERDFYFNEASGFVEWKPDLAKMIMARPGGLPANDKFGMMGRALFSSAFLVFVPPRVELTLPIHLKWRFGEESSSLQSRTIIYLAEGSRASIIEEFESEESKGEQSLFSNATEVFLEDGASLRYAAIEGFGDHVVSFLTRQAILNRDGKLNQALGSFGGFLCKSRADCILAGQGSSIRQVEVVYGNGSEKFDNTNFVVHVGRDTTSDLLAKAVMQEKSRSALKGVITIEDTALNTDSYLGQYSMLLSKKSKSTAIPSLEIKTNEVLRAKHSASVAQVDEDQLFYLMSRGIPRDRARRMLVEGFLTPIVEQVDLSQARDRIFELMDQKWVG